MLGAVDLFGRILIHTEHRNMSIGHDLRELLTGAHGTVDRISNRKKTSGESVSKISKWNLCGPGGDWDCDFLNKRCQSSDAGKQLCYTGK